MAKKQKQNTNSLSNKDKKDAPKKSFTKKSKHSLKSPINKEKKETPKKQSVKKDKQDLKSTPKKSSKKEKKDHPKDSKEKEEASGEVWSKSKKKRMRKLMAKGGGDTTRVEQGSSDRKSSKKQRLEKEDSNTKTEESGPKGKLSALQQSFMARLTGSRFRELNEDLYTTTSDAAYEKFSSQPELYEQYHEGFRHQVEAWPINPVNVIVKWLTLTYAQKAPCVVADFGCGDATLAKKLLAVKSKGSSSSPFDVHSFDLVASCDLVTACDMSHVPLKSNSVDVAVFCLSLMGTNLADFIREAHRVLKDTGILKIAEVRSRFESKKDELEDFIKVLDKLGFSCLRKDRSNKMFVMLELKPHGKRPDKKLEYSAKPCIYKRR